MISDWAELLAPSNKWRPLFDSGVVELNKSANRLVWSSTKRFAAALVPTNSLAEKLAAVPLDGSGISAAIKHFDFLGPALSQFQLIATVGAVASVATLGVALVGFGIVLQRLKRLDAKLDAMLVNVSELKESVAAIGTDMSAFFHARLASAHSSLQRALAASTDVERRELAHEARKLFLESRHRYLELWKRSSPWMTATIDLPTAIAIQGRYTAAAIGELQAEFLLGDVGAFKHACREAAGHLRDDMAIDTVRAFQCRTDAGCERCESEGPEEQSHFAGVVIDEIRTQAMLASGVTKQTAEHLASFEDDADLLERLPMPSHELLIALRDTKAVDVIAIGDLTPP